MLASETQNMACMNTNAIVLKFRRYCPFAKLLQQLNLCWCTFRHHRRRRRPPAAANGINIMIINRVLVATIVVVVVVVVEVLRIITSL